MNATAPILLLMTIATFVAAGCSHQSPRIISSAPSPAPILAHQVAEFEITIARISVAENSGSGGGNHPEQTMLDDMTDQNYPHGDRSGLTTEQVALVKDIVVRMVAARAGFEKANQGGLAAWDPAAIIQAAQESASGPLHADVPAALALDEIYNSKVIQDFAKTSP